MNTENVRCDKCGFLALCNIDDRHLTEADRVYRTTAEPPKSREWEVAEYDNIPICFRTKANLREEIKEQETKVLPKDILAVIQQERLCSEFEDWIQGFSPKEHLEMLIRQKELERQEQMSQQLANVASKRELRIVIVAGIFVMLGALIGLIP